MAEDGEESFLSGAGYNDYRKLNSRPRVDLVIGQDLLAAIINFPNGFLEAESYVLKQ